LLRDYDLDLNELIGKDKKSLIHLLIGEEDIENLELILSLPKDDYKTKAKPDLNIVDESWGWTPLITAMN
jgi:ankyrin repeat protein